MRSRIRAVTALAALAVSGAVFAAERTVTLAVENMDCVTCPYIVGESLEAVPGVSAAKVSFENKTAVVVFDDERADVAALVAATTNAGYPSHPIDQHRE